MAQTIGAYLRELIHARGVSQGWLARQAHLSRSTLVRWLSDQHQPSLDELNAVLNVLRVSTSERQQALSLLSAPRAVMQLRQDLGVHPAPSPPFGGDLLRAMRLRKGWTLEQVANALEVSVPTIHRWERSENWPTPDKLHALCYALGAYEEEVIVLTTGGIHLSSPLVNETVTLETLSQAFEQVSRIGNARLGTTLLLVLEAQAWYLARSHPEALRLLCDIYRLHAQALLYAGQLKEAERTAYRALRFLPTESPLLTGDSWVFHIIAKGTAEGSKRVAPMQGVQVYQDWLPAFQGFPEILIWFQQNVAEYLSQAGHTAAALALSAETLTMNARLGLDDRGARFSHAQVLLRAGHPHEALSYLLPLKEGEVPLESLNESLLWTEALLATGETSAAQDWLVRAYRIVEEQEAWSLKLRVDQIARCFRP